jgi:ribosomal protein S18 acetylase RimI-like enzyme
MSLQKIHMVRVLSGPLTPEPASSELRVMSSEDITQLGRLFLDAYIGTVDYEGESEQDALAAVQGAFDGEFGNFLSSASYVAQRAGELCSASFVTLWQGKPLLAFSVTAARHKGSGLAGRCISASMQALYQAGQPELHLFVSPGNFPALAVYKRLGFKA